MEEETEAHIKCPMCGGEEFEPGILRTNMNVKFKGCFSDKLVRAKRCNKCGFLSIFAEMPDDKMLDNEKLNDEMLDIRTLDDGMSDDKICL